MKYLIILLLIISNLSAFSQKNVEKITDQIVEEGKLLYKCEMASWYGTDVFLQIYKNRENIGGYFSYVDGDMAKCIFFSIGEDPKVIGTISFTESYNPNEATIVTEEREFTETEMDLYTIRLNAMIAINNDTLFKTYENTNLNLIPIIYKGEKKVYVLTGPEQSGVIIFGNDYLLTFNDKNKLKSKSQLHNNIIPFYYGSEESEGKKLVSGIHSHLPETGDFITATDICTLMLYAKYAELEQYYVTSKKYMSIWNCETNTLAIITQKALDKIYGDQEEKNK